MPDNGSSVTLVLYKVGAEWWKEPTLNLLAAAAQMSSYTHVELAIGEASGDGGQMANVARIYNDNVGVELCQRTGRNPAYTYLSLGCSQAQVNRMLQFARAQVGKPFSNSGMARSILFPRQSTFKTFYCAELVAAILKQGGLMSQDSNPGAATPYSLYKLYSKQAAATANPFTLRQAGGLKLTTLGMKGGIMSLNAPGAPAPIRAPVKPAGGSERRRTNSPPRASFRVLAPGALHATDGPQLTLSLTSLRS